MKTKKLLLSLIAVGVLCTTGYGLYSLGKHQGTQQKSLSNTQTGGSIDPETGKRVLYWHDPMVPGHKFDKPGKSPFMEMDLVPVFADENGETGKVTISPQMQQSLGIRTAEVKRGLSTPTLAQDVVLIQARANGYLERLYFSRNPLDPVRKGQALAELFVPDWVAAQEEYFAVRRMGSSAPAGLLEGAQQRMRLAGMLDQQIQAVQASSRIQRRFTITAPVDGILTLEPAAREGTTVMPGTPLFRITRTDSQSSSKEVLLIPSEALIQTGKRTVVITVLGDGGFRPVDVEVGQEVNGQTEVRKGLEVGQKVVVSGQFLIDSEASLKGVETRMQGGQP